jgi:hypothetical protein
MAQHDGGGKFLTPAQGLAQKAGAIFIAQVIMGMWIGVGAQQFRVMVCLHINEIGVLEPVREVTPFPKVGGHYQLFALSPMRGEDLEAKGGPAAVVGDRKRSDGNIPDGKGPIGKRTDLEAQERGEAKVPGGQRFDFFFVDVDGNPAFFQHPEGIMMDVVAVQVGDDHPVDSGQESVEDPPAGLHGWEPGIEEEGGIPGFQEQGISRAAAAEGLKGQRQYHLRSNY